MNDKSKKSKDAQAAEAREAEVVDKEQESGFAAELEELKRDMRSAQVVDWVQNNQQQLIAGAVALLLVLAGISLWMERAKSQKDSAATLYHQALASSEAGKKQAMLEMVTMDYDGTGYAALAHLYLAKLADNPEAHLNALIYGRGVTNEIAWQARLDLAEWYLSQEKSAEASKLLAEQVGKQYEQLRHYLMAEAATDAAEKKKHLQQSLDAISNDELLKARVESMLSQLDRGEQSGS